MRFANDQYALFVTTLRVLSSPKWLKGGADPEPVPSIKVAMAPVHMVATVEVIAVRPLVGKEPPPNRPRIGRLSVRGQRPRSEYDHHQHGGHHQRNGAYHKRTSFHSATTLAASIVTNDTKLEAWQDLRRVLKPLTQPKRLRQGAGCLYSQRCRQELFGHGRIRGVDSYYEPLERSYG
jgi:hypothetical protein